ncbi:hypothetical protein HYDPIDRAFT_164616 [Hydnomerulius pinastri MD-312]|nr:hypothetical protein HYDPIDRAFT_164616 [Hydnomerulius pinastri MD-312]
MATLHCADGGPTWPQANTNCCETALSPWHQPQQMHVAFPTDCPCIEYSNQLNIVWVKEAGLTDDSSGEEAKWDYIILLQYKYLQMALHTTPRVRVALHQTQGCNFPEELSDLGTCSKMRGRLEGKLEEVAVHAVMDVEQDAKMMRLRKSASQIHLKVEAPMQAMLGPTGHYDATDSGAPALTGLCASLVEHVISTDIDIADLLLATHALSEDSDELLDYISSNDNCPHAFIHPPPCKHPSHAFMCPTMSVASSLTPSAPSTCTGSKHISKSVQRHQCAGKKAHMAHWRCNKGVEAISYKLQSSLSKRHAKPQAVFIKMSIWSLQCAKGGYVGLPLKEKSFASQHLTLEELNAEYSMTSNV